MKYLQTWSENSQLRNNWYDFAAELIGKTNADNIWSTYFGGGNPVCLQEVLKLWYNSTTDHSWEVIIDVLKKMDERRVIDAIEEKFLMW